MVKIHEHTYKTKGALQSRTTTTSICLHCAATPEGKDYTVETIEKWHHSRGFQTIGYHYVIYRDGSIHRGRHEDTKGAHEPKVNATSVGICYIGGLAKDGKTAKDTRTPEQKEAMYELVEELMKKYNLTLQDVHCHREYAAKACPSFKPETFREEYRTWLEGKYAKYLQDKANTVPLIH